MFFVQLSELPAEGNDKESKTVTETNRYQAFISLLYNVTDSAKEYLNHF
jgi:hypothetical protein